MSVNGERLEAVGAARATYRNTVLTADRLDVDLDRDVARATGHVRVEREGQVLTGDEIIYDLRSGNASLVNAKATLTEDLGEGRITAHLLSDELRINEGIVYVTRARLTTCDRPHPHWQMRADRLTMTPHEGIEAQGTRVALYGIQSPRAPTLKLGFHERQENNPLFPGFGISARDSLYVGARAALLRGKRTSAAIAGRVGLKAGFRGRAYLTQDAGPTHIEAAFAYKEYVRDEVSRNLVVDRMPEIRVESVWPRAPGTRSGTLQLRLLGEWGRYRSALRGESGLTGRTTGDRANAEAELTYRQREGRRGRHGWNAGVSFRQSCYDHGDHLSVLGGRLGLYGALSPRFTGSVEYVRRFPFGTTPFEFDDIDITDELRPEATWRITPKWSIGAEVRYDIDRGEARRVGLTLGRVAHCLEYTVSYDTVLHDVGFGVNLATQP